MSGSRLQKKLNELFSLKEMKKSLSAELDETKSNFERVQCEVIELMTDQDLDRCDLEGKASFSISRPKYPRCVDRDRLRKYLIEAGKEEILTVNTMTLRSFFTNDATDEQRLDPSSIGCDVYEDARLNIRNKK